MHSGWWVRLEGEERDLRDLAMHFNDPALEVVEEKGAFWLSSSDFAALADPDRVQKRGRVLVALASGALHVEFGRFTPPRVVAAVEVDDTGAKKHFIHVSSSVRVHGEINTRIERARPDGSIEIVELVAPPAQTREWANLARHDEDVDDVLAILGRDDVRWHDLYHVFERPSTRSCAALSESGWPGAWNRLWPCRASPPIACRLFAVRVKRSTAALVTQFFVNIAPPTSASITSVRR